MKTQSKHWRKTGIAVTFIIIATIGFRAYGHQYHYKYTYPFPLSTSKNPIGSLSKEIDFYKQRIAERPGEGLDRANLAKIYLKMARSSKDIKWYTLAENLAKESLVKLPFNNHGALIVLAKVAEAKHDFTTTIRLSEQSLQIKPDNLDALTMLVTAHLAQGKVKVADRYANQLVEQTPTSNSLTLRALVNIAQGEDEKAIQDFKGAIASEEAGEIATSAKIRNLFGRYYLSRGKYSQAKDLFIESLRILPQYQEALINLAKLEAENGNYQKAEEYYNQVVDFGSKNKSHTLDHQALMGIAQVRKLQNDISGANDYWNKAEKSFQDHSHHSHTHHSHKHHSHKHHHEKHFGHQRDLAKLLLLRGKPQDLSKALSLIQSEVKIRRDADTLDTLAQVMQRLNRSQEAQKIYQEILKTGINNAQIFYHAGIVEKQLGNSEQANIYFQKAGEVNPTWKLKSKNQFL